MSNFLAPSRAKQHLSENVSYRLVDKDGNAKLQFEDWALNRLVLRWVRSFVKPYTDDGEQKTNVLSQLALYGLRIPYITGAWKYEAARANLITTVGKGLAAGLLNGVITNFFDYMGIGIGTTAANVSDTALETERDESGASNTNHKSATTSRVTTDTTNDTAQWVTTFNFSATLAITESGIFDATPSGNMLCRQVFSAINVVSGDSLQVTWKVDVD